MDIQLTRNDIKRNFTDIYSVGDDSRIHYLTYCKDRIGYASGKYGWNYNAFAFTGNVCLVGGYRTTGFKRIDPELTAKYEEYAKRNVMLYLNNELSWKTLEILNENVFLRFMQDVRKEEKQNEN